ncbi:MAG: RNA ligase family protein [Erysipelotrichaceae bacterium]|nr:RNA ligase family protein [Erysipelotrichaceae bacterium]
MQYKSYQHIERLGREEVEGILEGKCYIQPKIDGTNGVLFLGDDGVVHAGSRKKELTLEDDNAGFCKKLTGNSAILSYLQQHPDHYLFGEWLIPHTIRFYNEDSWQQFYIFDVFELSGENGRYLSYEEYVPLLEEYGLTYIPCLAVLDHPQEEQLAELLVKNHYLLAEDRTGEGIVIKNYDYKNRFGRTVWAKIVADEFFKKNNKIRRQDHEAKDSTWEKKITSTYITEAVVHKEYAKIMNEYPEASRQEIIGRVLNAVYLTFIEEDLITAVKTNKNLVLDFNRVKSESNALVKEYIPELFGNNWQRE